MIPSVPQCRTRDQSMLMGKALPPFHRKACWSSQKCTSLTQVSPLLFLLTTIVRLITFWHSLVWSSGLHPHQSGAPIANPTLYGGPPVSLSPGQPPQQLLPPPFYPPPGVMTFPYPAMYPSPQVPNKCFTLKLSNTQSFSLQSHFYCKKKKKSDLSVK